VRGNEDSLQGASLNHNESVGIWAIGLAQIGAQVGNLLRQNPKTRVTILQYKIAIFIQKNVC
jgi:hypothetical protein